MSEKRRDNRGRILHNGEIQKSDGRYRFKYLDINGQEKMIYSVRLDKNDPLPPGKKSCPSLRELERQIQADLFDQVASNGGNLSVLQLVEKYIATRVNVRPTTKSGYNTVVRVLEKDPV